MRSSQRSVGSSLAKRKLSVREVWGSIHIAIGAGGLRFDFLAGRIGTVSPTAHYRCDVSSDLRCPGAKLRRWAATCYTLRRYIASLMKI